MNTALGRYTKTAAAIAAAATLALLLSSGAQAALPSAHQTLIVPAKSLGGVKLGSSLAQATAAWGKGGRCTSDSCDYESKTGGSAAFLAAEASAGAPLEVVEITIIAPLVGTKYSVKTPLTKFKTANGIGIGSTVSQLKHAYPQAKLATTGLYILKGAGESLTDFDVTEGHVYGVEMQSVHLG